MTTTASPESCRVFLADDVAGIRALWRFYLSEEDVIEIVGEAGDGRTALVDIAALRPDVVVLDIVMPGLDGLEVLARLRVDLPDTAVILATSLTAAQLGEAAAADGVHGYFEKGGPPEQLISLIIAACCRNAPPPR